MRIVIVLIEPPLPFSTAAARWYYVLLRELAKRGYQVTTFVAVSNPKDIEPTHLAFPSPDYDIRCYPIERSRTLARKLRIYTHAGSHLIPEALQRDLDRTLAEGFDVLHLEQLSSGWAGLAHAARSLVSVHYLELIDQSEQIPETLALRIRRAAVFSSERRLVRAYPFFRSCSSRLETELRQLNRQAQVVTIPFGLETSLYPFIERDRRPQSKTLTLIGSMNWHPSYTAGVRLMERLWPEIKRQVPEAQVRIVGWHAREKMKPYLHLPDVEVLENVPDTRPYFEQTSVFLYAPGRGTGMKIKVMEAMAYGIPVVTTSEGVEGLPAVDGVEAGICEDDAGLIARTVALLNDPDAQERQRLAARAMIERHCSPAATVDAVEACYRQIAAARPR